MRAAFVLLLVACGEERALPPPPARPDPIPAALEAELDPPPPSSWPTHVDTLAGSLEAFTTVEACQQDLRERTATAVAEGLADLGYDGFFADTCAALDAVRRGSVEDCDALSVSSARGGCRTRVALVHARPEACPPSRVIDGPDPICVAWARRNPDLCAAVAAPDDVRCRAVLADDAQPCRRLRGGDRQRCEAQVRRYASALGDARSESPAARAPAVYRLEVGERTIERDVLARGVRAEVEGCRYEIALESPHGALSLPVAPGAFEPTFQLTLSIASFEAPIELALGALEAVLSVALPEHGTLSSIAGSGVVRVERFEREVGGALEGTIDGTLVHDGEEIRVRGRFTTFLRDIGPLPDHCAGQGAGER